MHKLFPVTVQGAFYVRNTDIGLYSTPYSAPHFDADVGIFFLPLKLTPTRSLCRKVSDYDTLLRQEINLIPGLQTFCLLLMGRPLPSSLASHSLDMIQVSLL